MLQKFTIHRFLFGIVSFCLVSSYAKAEDMIWRAVVIMPDQEQKTYLLTESDFKVPVNVRGWDLCTISKINLNNGLGERAIGCVRKNGDFVSENVICNPMTGSYGSLVVGNTKPKAPVTEIKLNCTSH
jgi:hypothetical protein